METCYNTVRVLSNRLSNYCSFTALVYRCCNRNRKDRNFGAVHRRDINDSVNGYVSTAYFFTYILSNTFSYLIVFGSSYCSIVRPFYQTRGRDKYFVSLNNIKSRLYPVRLFRCIVKISCHCYSVQFYLLFFGFLLFFFFL